MRHLRLIGSIIAVTAFTAALLITGMAFALTLAVVGWCVGMDEALERYKHEA